jgi:hypothetical protein
MPFPGSPREDLYLQRLIYKYKYKNKKNTLNTSNRRGHRGTWVPHSKKE